MSHRVLYRQRTAYQAIVCSRDVRAIQVDIEEVEQRADSNHLNLNATKCKYIFDNIKETMCNLFMHLLFEESPTGKS